MCGADGFWSGVEKLCGGSPPRVRSRRRVGRGPVRAVGITSACAEQTEPVDADVLHGGDHLRVCGADCLTNSFSITVEGSPPRVRSRQLHSTRLVGGVGITSACAEQTSRMATFRPWSTDHLRVCGADPTLDTAVATSSGSPPRVRSRPAVEPSVTEPGGITSACAEQTSGPQERQRRQRDHLRVCGADG